MMIKMIVGEVVVTVLSVYNSHTGLTIAEKELFYDNLQNLVQFIDDLEMLLICGDFNGHTGKAALGYEGIHDGYDLGKRNIDDERILEFAVANNVVEGNSKLGKKIIIVSGINLVAVQVKYIICYFNATNLI